MSKVYLKSTLYSFLLHLSIFLFLIIEIVFFKPNQAFNQRVTEKKSTKSIEAVSVDEHALRSEMKSILQRREQQQKEEKQKQEQAKAYLEQLKSSALKKEQELKRLNTQHKKLAQAKAIAQKEQEKRYEESMARQKKLAHKLKTYEKKLKTKKDSLKQVSEQLAKEKREREKERVAALKAAEEKHLKDLARQEREEQLQNEVNKYKSLILAAIGQNWIVPEASDVNLSSRFQVMLSSNGEVLNVTLEKSSGDSSLDRSARLAIFRASPLPVPKDKEAFKLFKVLNLTVTPKELRKVS